MLLLIRNCIGGENSWFVLEIMDGSSVRQKKNDIWVLFYQVILHPQTSNLSFLLWWGSSSHWSNAEGFSRRVSIQKKELNDFKFREWMTLWLFCPDQIWHEAHTGRHTGWFKWALITTNQSCVMTHEAGISAGVSSQLMHVLLIWYYGSTRSTEYHHKVLSAFL